MRFLFLNQYFPPDPAPTGVLLDELAEHLTSAGHTVDFVDARQGYRTQKGSGGRMLRELIGLGRMFIAGISRPRPDVVISATSPPCLGFVAGLIASRHGARHFHWVMDLYPEIAVALGEIRPGLLASTIKKLMGWAYRKADRVVVLDADMAKQIEEYGVKSEIIRPWVFSSLLEQRAEAFGSAVPDQPWSWIYSGNLGRAHEWLTLLEAQQIIENKDLEVRLIIQGGGPAWPAARQQALALGLRRCEWRGYVEEADLPRSLLRGGACVVTQRPEAKGLLWPSKLGLLLSLPRPIVWVGPGEGAIAGSLRETPGAGVFQPGQAGAIAEWILHLRGTRCQPGVAVDPYAHRSESLDRWLELLLRPRQGE